MFWTIGVIKVDFFGVDVLKLDVLGMRHTSQMEALAFK
jgi:hypothetical protein